MKKLFVYSVLYFLSFQIYSQNWYSMGNLDTAFFQTGRKFVEKIVFYDNKITIGGGFKKNLHGAVLNGVAQWNYNTWEPMGIGVWYPFDYSLETNDSTGNGGGGLENFRGEFYSAGVFFGAGGTAIDLNDASHICNDIAKWDGTDWHPLLIPGNGVHNGVNAICTALKAYNNNLYVGGYFGASFDSTGAHSTQGIAKWNGTVFSSVGLFAGDFPPNQDFSVLDFCIFNNKLIAGGYFTSINNSPYGAFSGIAMWNDTVWTSLGGGFNNAVSSLAIYNGELYAAGMFTSSRDSLTPLNHVAKWNGSTWLQVGEGLGVDSGLNDTVCVLTVDTVNNRLYAGGAFSQTGLGFPAKHLAEWTGTNWQEVGGGTNKEVWALFAKDGNLYVGGFFTTVGSNNLYAPLIACWGSNPAGVNELSYNNDINIYPNPFTSQTTISFSSEQTNTTIKITDILGKEIKAVHFTGKQCTIEKGTMKAGIYFVQITDEKKNIVNRKVVVQ